MATKLYSSRDIIMATYYDVIRLMGSEGLDAKLTAYDLLAVMAAPCTRLNYEETPKNQLTSLMTEVHMFVKNNQRVLNKTYQGLLKELNSSFLPSLSKDRQQELLMEFRMIMGFDADGYAVFDPKYYNVYKGNMDRGTYINIMYSALQGNKSLTDLPDKEISKTYYTKKENGMYVLDLDLSTQDWVDILRGASVKAMKLIEAYCNMPNKRATHFEIQENFGILSDSINGITAGLGNRVKRIMGIESLGTTGEPNCWSLPFNNGRYESDGSFSWQLRSEVAEAFVKLKR